MMRRLLSLCFLVYLAGCGIYTFDMYKIGSKLPPHLETVDIPLFENRSLEPGVAEEITTQLIQRVESTNLLAPVATRGDATITGVVVNYVNEPYTYGTQAARDVEVSQYVVRLNVSVVFTDNRENESIYEGTVQGEGIYDFESGSEEEGRREAIDDVIDRIMQNSVQSW